MPSVYECSIVELPKIQSERGSMTPIHGGATLPFDIQRIYYLYDIPGGETRGGHAHRELRQLIVAASGSFDVLLDDGVNRRVVHLNRPYYGLYLTNMIWRELLNFSSGGICLVLASDIYREDDYYRDYDDFIRDVKER